MKCEKCGREIESLEVDMFDWEGNDSWHEWPLEEHENGAFLDLDKNWTGDELSEEEQVETIRCPYCHEYPFKDTEIQTYSFIRVVMFKERT